MNVLVVEADSPHNSDIIRFIQQWGHNVQHSSSGEDAATKVKQMGFDLILLDTSLPDTTIYSLIPKLKELHPGIRIVTMTDHNTTEMERKIRKLGIIYYLIKPFQEDELKNILDHCSPNAKL